MDGLSVAAAVRELKRLVGGRIEKVQQPEKDELVLSIHTAGGSCRLLVSASPENCRITLTDEKKASPVDAPAFLMLLRKYLTGARIAGVNEPNSDRVVEFEIDSLSELHDPVRLKLVCEIMGRHSNVILIDGDGTIIDAIRRVPPSVSSARLVLPKLKYEYPPSKKKKDPMAAGHEEFAEALLAEGKPDIALAGAFYGLSPASAKRLIAALGGAAQGADALGRRLEDFYGALSRGEFEACVVTADGRPVCTLPFLPCGEEFVRYPSMSEAVVAFYEGRSRDESIRRRTSAYGHALKNAAAKLEKKLVIFSEAISGEEDNERMRLYGELLTANLHAIAHGADKAGVYNYYSDPPEPVEIPLDPMLSPAANAQRYYTRYRKAKLAREHALRMIDQVKAELDYYDELSYTLSCCESEAELNEIKAELTAAGLIKDDSRRKSGRSAAQKLPASKPLVFETRAGYAVFVGKNNRQNDKLTASAGANDLWLHTKDIHGSHVIVKNGVGAPDETLFDAAVLAAYYSQARGSGRVPVDYTPARYVKKPSGAKPGMVTYTHQHTVYVTPDAELIRKLIKS